MAQVLLISVKKVIDFNAVNRWRKAAECTKSEKASGNVAKLFFSHGSI